MNNLKQSLEQLKSQYESSQEKLLEQQLLHSSELEPSQKIQLLQSLLSSNLINKEQYEKYVLSISNLRRNCSTIWISKWNDQKLQESIIKNLCTAFKFGTPTPQPDSEDYHILVCKQEHLEHLVPLFVEYMQFYSHPISNTEAKEYLSRVWTSDAVILVAMAQTPIGFVVMFPMFECEILDRFWLLNDMFVDVNWRKKNIGGALVEQAKRICVDSGGKKLYLETLKDNLAAQKFYQKHGFVPDQVHMTWHMDFE